MKKYIAIIIIMLLAIAPKAKSQRSFQYIDSLEALSHYAADSTLPRLFCEMSYESRFNNPIMGIKYGLKAVDISEARQNTRYISVAYYCLALNERFANMWEASINHFNEALRHAQENNQQQIEGYCENAIARVLIAIRKTDEAKEHTEKAFVVAKKCNDSLILSQAYLNLGLVMNQKGKTELASGYLLESYEIRKNQMDHKDIDFLIPLWHLADIYMNQGEYHKAKEIININFNHPAFREWPDFMSRVWLKLAQIYYKTNMLDSAIIAGNRSMQLAQESRDMLKIENACKLLDSVYLAQGNYKKAAEITMAFSDNSDQLFNRDLYDELKKINYSTEYIENEKDIQKERDNRNISLVLLAASIIALIGSGIYFHLMRKSNRRIAQLNKELRRKRESMDRDLQYGHYIQMAIQPNIKDFGAIFSDKFLLYIPRDIVSGDFFWKFSDSRYEILVVADCTGHGVPGAMLTMLGTSMLHDIASSGIRKSGEILEQLRQKIKFMMGVNSLNRMQDGMDISLIIIDRETMTLDFSGAFNDLVYIHNGEMSVLKASRCPIGEYVMEIPFKSQTMQLQKDDCIYIMSDGYASQFGGDSNRKFSHKKLNEILLQNYQKPMQEVCDYLRKHFHEWRGNNEQIDDVTIAGFRV